MTVRSRELQMDEVFRQEPKAREIYTDLVMETAKLSAQMDAMKR